MQKFDECGRGVSMNRQRFLDVELLVGDRTQNGDGEVGEQRRTFVELEPANAAMIF